MSSSILRAPTLARLTDARQRLVQSHLYLGDRSIRDHIEWLRDGRCDRLIIKPEAQHADDAATPSDNDGHASDNDSPTPENSGPTESENDPNDPSSEDAPAFELASLRMTGVISPEDFFLTADGNWRPSIFTPSFVNVRPSGSIGAPDVTMFAADHPEVLNNLDWLQGLVSMRGYTVRRGLLVGPPEAPRVKVRHLLLEPLDELDPEPSESQADQQSTSASPAATQSTVASSPEPADDSDALSDTGATVASSQGAGAVASPEVPDPNAHLGREFRMENWPCYSDESRAAMAALRTARTHRIVPLPAYDMHGDLINPSLYRNRLSGALVEVHFSLTHWPIVGKKDTTDKAAARADVFVADLDYLRVLVPPKPSPVTPRKRKVSAIDTVSPSPSPSKKARTCGNFTGLQLSK